MAQNILYLITPKFEGQDLTRIRVYASDDSQARSMAYEVLKERLADVNASHLLPHIKLSLSTPPRFWKGK